MPEIINSKVKLALALCALFLVIGVGLFELSRDMENPLMAIASQNMKQELVVQREKISNFHRKFADTMKIALVYPHFTKHFSLPETMSGNRFDNSGVMGFSDNQRELKSQIENWTSNIQKNFLIVESCLINGSGQEHLRITNQKIAPDTELSPDEKQAPFFEPSFDLKKGEVHVQAPYMSQDALEWVFAYTSPVVVGTGEKPAFYHYEIPV